MWVACPVLFIIPRNYGISITYVHFRGDWRLLPLFSPLVFSMTGKACWPPVQTYSRSESRGPVIKKPGGETMSEMESSRRRIDVLAIGLFGLAVGALTLGAAQIGIIPSSDRVGTLVIALVFGGIVQILAGITDIRYHEQLGGTALTMYGFFWLTVCIAKLVSESTSFHLDMVLYVPINLVYAAFSAVMIYLTAYRNATLCMLHVIITGSFSFTVLAQLDFITETVPGLLHIMVGLMAFYHAVASLTQAFTGQQLVPLGSAFLHRVKLINESELPRAGHQHPMLEPEI